MHEIVYSHKAVQALDKLHRYITEELQSPQSARRVVAGIVNRIKILEQNPEAGLRLSSRIDIPKQVSQVRFLVCSKHIVVYEVVGEQVLILLIYHSSENVFGRVLSELGEPE